MQITGESFTDGNRELRLPTKLRGIFPSYSLILMLLQRQKDNWSFLTVLRFRHSKCECVSTVCDLEMRRLRKEKYVPMGDGVHVLCVCFVHVCKRECVCVCF